MQEYQIGLQCSAAPVFINSALRPRLLSYILPIPTKCLRHDSDSGQVYDFYTARRGAEENPHIVGDKTARNVMEWANLGTIP